MQAVSYVPISRGKIEIAPSELQYRKAPK